MNKAEVDEAVSLAVAATLYKVILEVEIEVLSDDIVMASIQFAHLGVPSAVVDLASPHLDFVGCPPFDVAEVIPPTVGPGLLEIAIGYDVLPASFSQHLEVIHSQPERIRNALSSEFQHILAHNRTHLHLTGMELVVGWPDG